MLLRLALLILCSPAFANAAGVFKCTGSDGAVEYRSKPCPAAADQVQIEVSDPKLRPCERHECRDSEHACLRQIAPQLEELSCREQRETNIRETISYYMEERKRIFAPCERAMDRAWEKIERQRDEVNDRVKDLGE